MLDLFHRVEITTSSGVNAWAYEYCGDDQFDHIASGDWLDTEESRGRGDGTNGTLCDSEVCRDVAQPARDSNDFL